MARMHSRARGNARSHKPLEPKKSTWVRYKPKEIELLVGKLAKKGYTSSVIGTILRDSYGIPDVKFLTGKKITGILGVNESGLPEDLISLIKRSAVIRKHLTANHHDMPAKRGLQLTDSKIRRLTKYYKESGRMPADWKFDEKVLRAHSE